MGKDDASRREFLIRAAVSAGAVASTAFVTPAETHNGTPGTESAISMPVQPLPHGEGQCAFFNQEDAATIAAFTERLMPSAPGKPGASDANVLNYIDLALAGAYTDLQDLYRSGLAQLDAHCRKIYNAPFAQLGESQQDEVVASLDKGETSGFTWPTAQEFFITLRTHTMEGMFADPVYGGNRDFAGWRLVGFPGAQMNFTPNDMHSSQAFGRVPIIGLQEQVKSSKQGA